MLEFRLLFGCGFGDATQADFAAVGGGQNNVGALDSRKQCKNLGPRTDTGAAGNHNTYG